MGYARYVYEQNHGTTDWGTGEAVSLSSSNGADQLRKALENTQPGAHIRLDKKHSVIFTGTTSNGFTVYECNRSGRNCEVQSPHIPILVQRALMITLQYTNKCL